ncbi:Glu-tRNA(Gln) amidotransferase subunit GatD [Candidatus Pacearchaeota archaeon]|nr:Glu-tRNA(Gln) amidotransferase subunit GatD [Candidatus Pacearchaeota archaeon]
MKSDKVSPGDYVEVHLGKVIYEGVLLEAPEDEKGIILLKLDSGYNIGFNKKDIFDIKLVEKQERKEEKIEIKKDSSKPIVSVIMTGGTIVNRLDSKTGAVSPLTSPEDFFKFYPDIFQIITPRIEMPFMKASEDMDFKDWQKIAKTVEKNLNDQNVKGVIITHGTDTLHYTSSALSFFLGKVNKPVVLTYSQRSSDRASSDANLNLKCAALASVSDIAEVMLVGHATSDDDFCYAMPGTKVRKLHSSRRDAFKVVNSKPFAKIFPDRIEILKEHRTRNNNKIKADIKFEEKVALVNFYPGQDADLLDYYIKKGYKGVVIEALGLGHVAVNGKNSWIKKLREVQKKMIVCFAPQTIYGRIDPYVYSNLREIAKTGVIYLEDMLSETAFVKLGWVLGHENWAKNKETIKEKMLENFAGELNARLEN